MRITNTMLLENLRSMFETNLYAYKTDPQRIQIKVISSPGSYPAGLELASKGVPTHPINVPVLWGSRESRYFDEIGEMNAKQAIHNVLSCEPPLVFLSSSVKNQWVDVIVNVANKYSICVIVSKLHAREISVDIYQYLALYFAPNTTLHAAAIVVNNVGIIIMGEPGIGKSETIIDLIQRGHAFIGDDSIIVKRIGSAFMMESSPITRNLIEARGIGIIDATNIFGQKSFIESHSLGLVIKLKNWVPGEDTNEFERLGHELEKMEILGSSIPQVTIPVSTGRNIATLIELAANVFTSRLKKDYVPITRIIEKRF